MNKCPTCGSTDVHHNEQDEHFFQVVSSTDREGEPLALLIQCQSFYGSDSSKARYLARARAHMRKYFPTKEFEIQPGRLILRRGYESSVLLGEAHVASYIAYEK